MGTLLRVSCGLGSAAVGLTTIVANVRLTVDAYVWSCYVSQPCAHSLVLVVTQFGRLRNSSCGWAMAWHQDRRLTDSHFDLVCAVERKHFRAMLPFLEV